MNNSSGPPSGNSLPQGEKRKRSSEPPPPPQNVNKAAVTRARIVEILASTANGCLSELGYFPGMPARLKELEKQNLTWKEENVKLFQDNRHLLAMVRHKSKQLELSGASDTEKLQKMVDLENEVHRLRMENEQLRRNPEYHKLLDDYRKLTDSYRLAYSEVIRLSAELKAVVERNQQRPGPPPQHPQQPPHQLQRSQSISHMPRSAMMISHGQPVMIAQGVQPMIPPPTFIPPHQQTQNISQQSQRIDALTQPQVFQNRQFAGSNPGSRRSSLNISNPPIQVPSQGPNSPAQAVPQSAQQQFQSPQFGLAGPSPQTAVAPAPPPDAPHARRVSAPMLVPIPPNGNPYPVLPLQDFDPRDPNFPQGNPYPVMQPAQPVPLQGAPVRRHSQPVNAPAVRTGSAPLPIRTSVPNQPPDIQLPPPPMSASSILAQTSMFSPQGPSLPTQPASIPSPTRPEQPQVQTISPQETYINPPGQPEVSPAGAQSSAAQQSFAAVQNVQQTEGPSANSLVAPNTIHAPVAQPPLRPEDFSPFHDENTPMQQVQEAPSVVNHHQQQNASAAVADPMPLMSTPEQEDQMQVDVAEGDEESEEEVEVGPDGLRLVRDCLEQLFGKSRVGEVRCLFCQARFEQQVVDQPPEPFINPTDEQLEAHCVEEHKVVWDQLREP